MQKAASAYRPGPLIFRILELTDEEQRRLSRGGQVAQHVVNPVERSEFPFVRQRRTAPEFLLEIVGQGRTAGFADLADECLQGLLRPCRERDAEARRRGRRGRGDDAGRRDAGGGRGRAPVGRGRG